MDLQPLLIDGVLEAGAVFGWRPLVLMRTVALHL
jgi:hypothetical protein